MSVLVYFVFAVIKTFVWSLLWRVWWGSRRKTRAIVEPYYHITTQTVRRKYFPPVFLCDRVVSVLTYQRASLYIHGQTGRPKAQWVVQGSALKKHDTNMARPDSYSVVLAWHDASVHARPEPSTQCHLNISQLWAWHDLTRQNNSNGLSRQSYLKYRAIKIHPTFY